MSDQVPDVFAAFECAVCRSRDPIWITSNHSEHPFASSGRLNCRTCGTTFPLRDGYLDLYPGEPEPVTPIQHLMQFPPIVALYEDWWRPIGYFIASKHSFPKDVDRIASLIQRRQGMGRAKRSAQNAGPFLIIISKTLLLRWFEDRNFITHTGAVTGFSRYHIEFHVLVIS